MWIFSFKLFWIKLHWCLSKTIPIKSYKHVKHVWKFSFSMLHHTEKLIFFFRKFLSNFLKIILLLKLHKCKTFLKWWFFTNYIYIESGKYTKLEIKVEKSTQNTSLHTHPLENSWFFHHFLWNLKLRHVNFHISNVLNKYMTRMISFR